MKNCFIIILGLLLFGPGLRAQSLEIMAGSDGVFMDVQYLKFIDKHKRFSVFSRSRSMTDYAGEEIDMFSGAYLNYTTQCGFGASLVGRIASSSSGVDVGLHYFKSNKTWMIYALPTIHIDDNLLYSWFSIVRYTRERSESSNWIFGYELFTAFGEDGHLSTVQRLRGGLEINGFQFGPALNHQLFESHEDKINFGIFIKKQF